MKSLKLDVPFSNCEYYTCDYVALDALLGFYEYATPQVIHNQWFFLYEQGDYDKFRTAPRYISIVDSMKQCGIQVDERQHADADVAWKHAKARIESGDPVGALADSYQLEAHYYPGLGHRSNHYVILAGFDDEKETVHVVDPSWIVRFRGDLPLSDFKSAWISDVGEGYKWVELSPPKSRWTLTEEHALQAIGRNIQAMLHANHTAPETFIGLEALQVLSDDLTRWKDLEVNRAHTCLKQLHSQLRYTVIERDGHGRYLRLIAEHLREPKFAQIGDQLRTITQKWLVFRNLCFKAQKKAMAQTLEKLHGRLLEIRSLEENALLEMKKHTLSRDDDPNGR